MEGNNSGSDSSIRDRADRKVRDALHEKLDRELRWAIVVSLSTRVWLFLQFLFSPIKSMYSLFVQAWEEDGPERRFVRDLMMDIGVIVIYALFLRISSLILIVSTPQNSPIRTIGDGILLVALKVSHYIPLAIFIIYRILRLVQYLHNAWNEE